MKSKHIIKFLWLFHSVRLGFRYRNKALNNKMAEFLTTVVHRAWHIKNIRKNRRLREIKALLRIIEILKPVKK